MDTLPSSPCAAVSPPATIMIGWIDSCSGSGSAAGFCSVLLDRQAEMRLQAWPIGSGLNQERDRPALFLGQQRGQQIAPANRGEVLAGGESVRLIEGALQRWGEFEFHGCRGVKSLCYLRQNTGDA